MQPAHNRGAISAMMINILLVVGIGVAVTLLLFRANPETNTQTSVSKPPMQAPAQTASTESPVSTATAIVPDARSQQEIDALKAQLEAESRALEEAKKQEEMIAKFRQEQDRAKLETTPATQSEVENTSAATKVEKTDNSESQTTDTGVETTAANTATAPKRRLITPMGFPE